MQRREFSLSATFGVLAGAGALAGLPVTAQAQARAFKEGADYLRLKNPAPVESPAGKVEVVEFFWYGCTHCNSFEPQLEAWSKNIPKDAVLRRVPVAFRSDFEPHQRLFYTLEEMGKLPQLHKKVFQTIHEQRQPLNSAQLVTAWAGAQGIDTAKFTAMYNSFGVSTKVRKATQLQDQYQVEGVPSLGVAGRFITSQEYAKSMERALQVVDYLVGQSKSNKAG
jgi:protein dithiol oxidoreductase (disulfide-forming)